MNCFLLEQTKINESQHVLTGTVINTTVQDKITISSIGFVPKGAILIRTGSTTHTHTVICSSVGGVYYNASAFPFDIGIGVVLGANSVIFNAYSSSAAFPRNVTYQYVIWG